MKIWSLIFVWTSRDQLAHSKGKTQLPIVCLTLLWMDPCSWELCTAPSLPPDTHPPTPRSLPPFMLPSVTPHGLSPESPGQRLLWVPPPGSHPSSLSAACRFFLHNISEIWPSLPICTAKTLVKTLSISHLNYCKILLLAWQMQPHPALPTPSPCPATTIPANHSLKSFMLKRITHKHLLQVIFLAGDHKTTVMAHAPIWMWFCRCSPWCEEWWAGAGSHISQSHRDQIKHLGPNSALK